MSAPPPAGKGLITGGIVVTAVEDVGGVVEAEVIASSWSMEV